MALRKAALKKAQETAQAKVEAQEKETSIPKKPRTRKKKSEKSDIDK